MPSWRNILMLQPSKILFKWFSDNELKGNAHKSHLLVSIDDSTKIEGDSVVENSSSEKLMDIKIDSKLNVPQSNYLKIWDSSSLKVRPLQI